MPVSCQIMYPLLQSFSSSELSFLTTRQCFTNFYRKPMAVRYLTLYFDKHRLLAKIAYGFSWHTFRWVTKFDMTRALGYCLFYNFSLRFVPKYYLDANIWGPLLCWDTDSGLVSALGSCHSSLWIVAVRLGRAAICHHFLRGLLPFSQMTCHTNLN